MSSGFELNDYQKKALDLQRDIIVSAGAGSGKTRVLVSRYCELFKADSALNLDNVVAITFTEKAAAELRERVDQSFRQIMNDPQHKSSRHRYKNFVENLSRAWIGTIHGFCSKILREFPIEARVDSDFTVLEESQATALLDEALEELLVRTSKNPKSPLSDDLKILVPHLGKGEIKEILKILIKDRDKAEQHIKNPVSYQTILLSLFNLYKEALKEYDARKGYGVWLDFTDLLIKATELVETNKTVREKLQKRFQYILVDEFQDTDPLQWKLIQLLTKNRKSGCLFLVGDPKQSIYGFRRADVSLFNKATEIIKKKNQAEQKNNLALKYEGHTIPSEKDEKLGVMKLPVNYRSVPAIIDFVNHVFEKIMNDAQNNNSVKFEPLESHRPEEEGGVEIIYAPEKTDNSSLLNQEYELIALRILELLDKNREPHYNPKDIAILIRSSAPLKEIEEALISYNIPFITTGGKGFFERQEIMDLCSLIKFMISPENDIALFCLLRSPYLKLDDKDNLIYSISHIKANCFWDKLANFSNSNEKIKDIVNMLQRYQTMAQRVPLSLLLKDFLTETKGWEYLSSGKESQRKMENVEKFITMARDFDDAGFQSLIDFSEQIETQKELAEQEAEAPLLLEDIDAVKIMTIHKAKGLQFPVVILPKISHEFNNKTSPCLIDEVEGIAIRIGDEASETRIAYEQLCKNQKQKNRDEEKRIFYVGATRAENLLILGITQSKPGRENCDSRLKMLKGVFELLKENLIDKEKIIYTTNGQERVIPIIKQNNISESKGKAMPPIVLDIPTDLPKSASPLPLPEARRIYDVTKLQDFAKCPLNYYLKHIIGLPEEALESSFENDDAGYAKGNRKFNMLRGTIIHALLEKFPFKNNTNANEIISSLLDNDKSLTKEERKTLAKDVQTSWLKMEKCDFIRTIASYKERHSELPFQITFGRDVLMGRVDACVKNDAGDWMIIDFKTGYKSFNERQVEQLYKIQIESYALFLSHFAPDQNNWEVRICMADSKVIYKNKYNLKEINYIYDSLEGLIRDEKIFRKTFESSSENHNMSGETKDRICQLCHHKNNLSCLMIKSQSRKGAVERG